MIVGFALGACGGGGDGAAPISDVDLAAVCRSACERDVACDFEPELEACVDRCVQGFGGWGRQDALEDLGDCVVATACTEDDDLCFDEIEPLAVHEEWEARCRAGYAACVTEDADALCEVDPASPEAGDGRWFSFVAGPVMREIIDCLDTQPDCETQEACVVAILDAYGIEFLRD